MGCSGEKLVFSKKFFVYIVTRGVLWVFCLFIFMRNG